MTIEQIILVIASALILGALLSWLYELIAYAIYQRNYSLLSLITGAVMLLGLLIYQVV